MTGGADSLAVPRNDKGVGRVDIFRIRRDFRKAVSLAIMVNYPQKKGSYAQNPNSFGRKSKKNGAKYLLIFLK